MRTSILIIDDEPNITFLLSHRLEKEGYTVYTAQNAKEAFKKIEEKKPDAIILDIMLPETNGIEICEKLRRDQKFKSTPIIMLSARPISPEMQEKLKNISNSYIKKPFKSEKIIETLKNLMQS